MNTHKYLAIFIGFVLLVLLAWLPLTPSEASSDSSCQSAWNQSDASGSCYGAQGRGSSAQVEWRSTRQMCFVSAHCSYTDAAGSRTLNYNQLYGSTGDLSSLKNCDGELKENC